MTLSETAEKRLADVVELQPTKNAELQERWGVESGSDVHQYLETELGDYYYRDDNSLIRATEEAAELVDVAPGVESDANDVPSRIRVPELHARIVDILAGPDEESESVVSVLHNVRAVYETDADVDDVRDALKHLRRKGVVEVEYRSVPTYRLAVPRAELDVDIAD